MLYVPAQEFQWALSSQAGVRPAAAYGTIITPGNNTKGAWAELLSDTLLVNDVYGILVQINSNAVTTAARDTIVDIGGDPAGGTAYVTIIPDLLASCAAPLTVGTGGFCYYFPVFIRSGTALAARASVNNATVGTLRVWITVFGRPKHPELVKVGQYVTAVGIVAASSRGTTVTPGTTAEGAYTSLGTPTSSHWWWQLGIGCNDATMSAVIYHCDIAAGDATNRRVLLEDILAMSPGTTEQLGLLPHGGEALIPASTEIWARCQCSGTADAGVSMAAYAVGG